MFNIWQSWFEAARFGCDVQNVIALRSMRFMQGGPDASAEARRMVSEKFAAFAAAQAAVAYALAMGKTPEAAAELALAPVRRRVRANVRRLSRTPLRGDPNSSGGRERARTPCR